MKQNKNLLNLQLCTKFFFAISLIICTLTLAGQNETNYFTIYENQLAFFEQQALEQGIDIWEVEGYKDFMRWADFFSTRHGEDGNIEDYVTAINNYYTGEGSMAYETQPVWNYIGHTSIYPQPDGQYTFHVGQGWINRIWVDPNDNNHILAGSHNAGVWETKDGGNIWLPITDNEQYRAIKGISSLEVYESNNMVYLCSVVNPTGLWGYSNGLYYSNLDDPNQEWTYLSVKVSGNDIYPTANIDYKPVKWLIHPDNEDIMFLLTWDYLFRSLDGGTTWNQIMQGNYNHWWNELGFKDMEFDPANTDNLYVTGAHVHKLSDLDNPIMPNKEDITSIITDFTTQTDQDRFKILVDVVNDILFYDKIWFAVKFYDGEYDDITYSGNDGIVEYTPSTGDVDVLYEEDYFLDKLKMQCEVSPYSSENLKIFLGGLGYDDFEPIDIFVEGLGRVHIQSDNVPDNWVHVDIRDADFIIDNITGEEKIYVACDGGVYYAEESEDDWIWTYIANDGTDGITNGELHGFDCSNTENDILYAGFQDMNAAIRNDGNWYRVLGGDGSCGIIDDANPNNIIGSYWGGATFYRSTNGGMNWTLIDNLENNKPGLALTNNDPYPPDLIVGDRRRILKYNNIFNTIDGDDKLILTEDEYNGNLDFKEIALHPSASSYILASTDRYFYDVPEEDYGKALYFSVVNGQDWEDISVGLADGLKGGPITGIQFDPQDQNTYYTSFGLTSTGEGDEKKKVYKGYLDFETESITWEPMANGLPPDIPVNDIRFDHGSNTLYLANDIGIYFYDKYNEIWKFIGEQLPPAICLHIRFNHALKKMRIGTYGRGIWETDLPCMYYPDYIEYITEPDVIWYNEKIIDHDVVVKANAQLTITDDVYFAEGASLIVEPEGKLIVDGGRLTNLCEGFWEGVEVQGNPFTGNETDQGKVILRDGAVIENAIIGIKAFHFDGVTSPSLFGGIIDAKSSVFKNNKISVFIRDYYFNTPTTFEACEFMIDNDYIGGAYTDNMIQLFNMHGPALYQPVTFTFCHFVNDQRGTEPLGVAIKSINSKFICEGNNTNSDGPEEPTFATITYFKYGIYALNTGIAPMVNPKINYVAFSENKHAAYFSGVDYLQFINDSIYLLNHSDAYGLYLDECSSFLVEDNEFYGPEIIFGDPIGIGTIINKSGTDDNEIYRNYYENLNVGVLAQNENRHKSGLTGLCIKCNDYENNASDLVVTQDDGIFGTAEDGIRSTQGAASSNPEDMAGNLFDIHSEIPNDDYDDINNEANHIIYYYPANVDPLFERVEPKDYTSNTVEPIPWTVNVPLWSYELGCPESEPENETELLGKINDAENNITNTQNTLAVLIDGGDTETLETEVDNSIPPDSMEVYTELMNESPYLSESVVSSAIEKEDVLPSAMIRDIMVANPKAAKSDELINQLDERWEPLPEYMKAQIIQGRSIVSIREETESQLANFQLQKANAFNALVRFYLNDEENPTVAYAALKSFIGNEANVNKQYSFAFILLEEGNFTQGLNVLNQVANDYVMDEEEQNAYELLVDYYNLLADIQQQNISLDELDETQLGMLTDMEQSSGKAALYARNILLALEATSYDEPIILPDILKSSEAQAEYEALLEKVNEAPDYLLLQPNPAKDHIIVEFEMEKEENVMIQIHNMSGVLKQSNILTAEQDQWVVDTRGFKPGVYICTLKVDNKLLESEKFTVIE